MKSFYTEMTSSKHHVRNYAKYDRVTALGVPKIRPVSENDMNALHALLDVPGSSTGRYQNSCQWRGHSQPNIHKDKDKEKEQLCCDIERWQYFQGLILSLCQ